MSTTTGRGIGAILQVESIPTVDPMKVGPVYHDRLRLRRRPDEFSRMLADFDRVALALETEGIDDPSMALRCRHIGPHAPVLYRGYETLLCEDCARGFRDWLRSLCP